MFFKDPFSHWQRGTKENFSGCLRQYLPKGMDLSVYIQRELHAIAHRLNLDREKFFDGAICP